MSFSSHNMDDLLCTENLTNYYENETQQQAPQTQPIQTTATSSSSFLGTRTSTNQEASSPYSDASLSSSGSLSCSSGYVSNASSSSNYGSSAALHFDFSKCSYSHSRYITCSGCSNQRQQQQKIIVTTTTATSVTPQRVERSNSVDGGGGAGINIKNGLVMVNSVEHYRNFDHNRPKTTQSTQTHNNNNNHSQSFQMNNAYINKQLNNNLNNVNTATEDPTFLTDRCLENALKTEEKRPHTICTYFKTVQKDITPPMRKIVAEWMMEVCAEEKCQEEVVLLALNYMDRFLSTKPVRKTHLQILAAACLLLASKLREPSCRALSAELLVFYTDNSIFKNDLIKWELFVLSRLGWDLSSVTPLDFLELLLIRLPIRSTKYPDLNVDTVRQHAQAFISLAAKEHHFSIYSASTIAASSIAAALSGLNWHLRSGKNLRYLLNLLTDLTSVEQDFLHECMIKMEAIFEEHSRNLQPFADSEETHQQQQHLDEDSTQQYNQHEQYQLQQHHQLHNQQQSPQQQLPQQQHTTAAPPQNLHHHSHHIHHGTIMHSTQPPEHFGLHGNSVAAVAVAAAGNVLLPDLTQTCKMQANTQKDVQDIKF